MERRVGSTTVAVTAEEVRAAFRRLTTATSEEEKVLRMRYGVGGEPEGPLPRAAGGNVDLADELTLIEMQLMRAFRARAEGKAAVVGRIGAPRNAAKEKIVRALRKKH